MIARTTGLDTGRFPLRRCPQVLTTGVIPPPFDNRWSCFWSLGNERINHGNPVNLSFDSATPFSISAWFKTIWGGTVMALFSKRQNVAPFRGYELFFNPSNGRFGLSLASVDNVNELEVRVDTIIGSLNDGAWHHALWTYDGSMTPAGIACYIDGGPSPLTIVNNSLTGTILAPATSVGQGARGVGTGSIARFWREGNIDEVSVWNRALTAGEATTVYVIRNIATLGIYSLNCISWWRNGDPTGPPTFPIIADQKNGNTGTMAGSFAPVDIVADAPP